ncbi:hypothetical protein N0V90_006832 [Kalmusia sp. IMI 367209]|nr:hypothetical protein N0V90_006832 [Kalmusia sp. IMI 367209]
MFTSQTLSALALVMLAMAPSAHSHMIMASPEPFGSPNNSPLDPSGSDYPCKMTSATAGEGPMNDFKVGSSQQLSFTGSAVHGGGSCQLAVTTDKNPTKDSKFKVIHSIEGGCPGVNGPSTFQFDVPDALPNGEAVFAWTWFNHIGNREMYMNCAHITVSGGKDDTAAFEKLPDMALANINVGSGASCKTAESSDYTFDGVGKNGDTVERVGSGPFVGLCGGAASPGTGGSGNTGAAPSAGTGSGSGSGSANNGLYTPGPGEGGAAQQTPAASSQAPAASSQAPVSSAAAVPATSQAPAASSQPADAVTSTINTLVTVTAPTAPASATAPANSSQPTEAPVSSAPAAAPSGGASTSTCGTDGQVVCNGETQFGLCNHGTVVFQAVAPGTKCQNGQVLRKRDFTHRAQRTAIPLVF